MNDWDAVKVVKDANGLLECQRCGKVMPDTFDILFAHHARTEEHHGVKISECDAICISKDGP